MEVTETVKRLDDEVKILKNEIQAILLDIREAYLNRENPFNPEVSAPTISSVVAASMMGAAKAAGGSAGDVSKNAKTAENESKENTGTKETKSQPSSAVNTTPPPEAPHNEDKNMMKETIPSEELTASSIDKNGNGKNGHRPAASQLDLSVIAAMAQWANEAGRKLGPVKIETILDIMDIAGYLQPELKMVLLKLVQRIPAEEVAKAVSTHDYIDLMIRLEDLTGMNSKSNELGLLKIFCQEV